MMSLPVWLPAPIFLWMVSVKGRFCEEVSVKGGVSVKDALWTETHW